MGKRRILIADDSPAETERIRKTVETLAGVEVVAVDDGAAAVSECKRSRFDLVLCDFEMPGLNGLQVVRLLRTSWSRLELPILMLTVRDDVQTKVLSLKQGANDYVTKPAEPEELLARVQGQLDLKAAVEANISARVRILEGRKLATIGRLAAGLAHDLNTPAQFTADNLVFLQKAVKHSCELLGRTREQLVAQPAGEGGLADEFLAFWQTKRLGYLVEEAPKALDEALNGIMRMAKTVRELKEFAGGPDASWGPADLNRALENTVAVSRQAWSLYAEISLELDRSLPPIACDVTALKQAFFDILMAAVERAPRQERGARLAAGTASRAAVAVAGVTQHVTIVTRRATDGVEVLFRDSGPPLSAELSLALRAEQASSEQLELLDARGLGMAYSVVVGQHQGQIHDEAMAGQGATLCIRLREGLPNPRQRQPMPTHSLPASSGRRP
jgi:DNA-binding response OmpR family regulator